MGNSIWFPPRAVVPLAPLAMPPERRIGARSTATQRVAGIQSIGSEVHNSSSASRMKAGAVDDRGVNSGHATSRECGGDRVGSCAHVQKAGITYVVGIECQKSVGGDVAQVVRSQHHSGTQLALNTNIHLDRTRRLMHIDRHQS